jgi:hypothetical protein
MNNSDATLVIILSEIILFLLVVVIAFITVAIIKRRQKGKLLKTIAESISGEKSNRLEAIKKGLKGIPSVSDEKINNIAGEAVKAEAIFYEYVIGLLYKQNKDKLAKLQESVASLASPYFLLAGKDDGNKVTKPDSEEPIIPNVDDAIDDLLEEDSDSDTDPEFDLSAQDEIAEIPADLLDEPKS